MARRKEQNLNSEQLSLYDYQLKEVNVRLVLNESAGLYSTTPIRTPNDAVNVMGELLRGCDREMVCVVNMDTKLRPINYNIVSVGGISSSMVPIANTFKTALLTANAACVSLLHCHPSGDASPSQEDFDVTKRFVQAGKLLDIPVIDHVIIGAYQGEMFSFRENHPDMFYAEPDLSVFPEIDPSKGWSQVAEHASDPKPSVLGRLEGKKSQVAAKAADKPYKDRIKHDHSLE